MRGIPFFSLLTALLVLGAEILYISLNFDAYSPNTASGKSELQTFFSQLGQWAKFFVLTAFIYFLMAGKRLLPAVSQILLAFSATRFSFAFVIHLFCYFVLLKLTARVFPDTQIRELLPVWLYLAWLGCATAVVVFWIIAVAGPVMLGQFVKAEWGTMVISILISAATWWLSILSQSSWEGMAEATFIVSASLLKLISPELLYVDVSHRELGLGNFVVNIASECSGYEGVGLITAFTAVYLYMERKLLRFPRALLLFPLGAVVIWLFNALRIAVLVALGYYWSPTIAVGGFHSQAGWITFILTSLGLLWISGHNQFFLLPKLSNVAENRPLNLPVATLIPLVALLAVTLLESAFAAGFNYGYPLRVIIVLAALIWVWKALDMAPYRPSWLVLPAAMLVAILWVVISGPNPQADAEFASGLASLNDWSLIWLAFRVVGTTITVPIAEELGFRAYLLCKLAKVDVCTRGAIPLTALSIVLSSFAFGLLHGAWVAGTVAGIIYALVRLKTKHIGDAIVAHGLTNALLAVYAMVTGAWSVL